MELGIENEEELFSAGLDSDRESDSTLSATSESVVGCSSPIVKYSQASLSKSGCMSQGEVASGSTDPLAMIIQQMASSLE